MISLIQRVSEASVTVDKEVIGSIGQGLLVLLGVEKTDDETSARRMVEKLLAYRVFSDEAGKMNLSLTDIGGQILVVPQFTLVADTGRGLRPSFSNGASPDVGKALFTQVVDIIRETQPVETGRFGADMAVQLVNDGPVTFWLQV